MRKKLKKFKILSQQKRYRRKLSVRAKIIGSAERPRICAIRSNKHLAIQVVDDVACKTLLAFNTFGKKSVSKGLSGMEGAKVVGVKLAEELKKKGFERAVFDRNGRPYAGVLSALVDSLRQNGISI